MTDAPMQDDFSEEERAWIARCGDEPTGRWLVRYARAFNRLDIAPLTLGLSPEVTYDSQSVFYQFVGPDRVLAYWRDKFDGIRQSGRSVAAELAQLPGGQPCVAMYQAASAYDANWLDAPLAAMTIKTNAKGEAESFLMITCVPSPASARGSGIFPGRTERPSAHPKRFVRTSPHFDEISLHVFYLDGVIGLDRAMEQSIAQARAELPGIRIMESSYANADNCPEWGVIHVFGFDGFPSVGAMFAGQPIYRHQGLIGGAALVSAIRKAAPIYVAASNLDDSKSSG